MKRLLPTLSILLVIAAAGMLNAYPTLLGPSGGTNLPTATVTETGKFNLAVDYYDISSEGPGFEVDPAIPVRLLYGVSPNVEIGATYIFQDAEVLGVSVDNDLWGLNFKYFSPVVPGQSGWAAGAIYAQNENGAADIDAFQLYLVGSKVLSRGNRTSPTVRGSLGVNWTSFDFGPADEDAFRPYVSLELLFPSRLSLNLEYQFKDDDVDEDAVSSICARYPFNENISGQIGFTNSIGLVGADDHEFLAGLNFRFGAGK